MHGKLTIQAPNDAPSKPANHQRGERAASAEEVTPKPQPSRHPRAPSARRSGAQAIIEAALDEFIARGFTATRLDDVAKRAGVAKGTIYLHFKDKESMFEELIRTALVPLIGRLHAPPPIGGSVARCDRGVCADLHPGGRGDAARRHRAPDRRRGPAVSRRSPTSTIARWFRAGLPACAR